METNIEELVKLFFQYGPFFLVPFILLYIVPKLNKQIKSASKEQAPVLKMQTYLWTGTAFVLIVLCAGFWIYERIGPKFYYGEILKIDPTYTISSPHLFLSAQRSGSDYTVNWIWKTEKDDIDAKINFVRGEGSIMPAKIFYLYCEMLSKRKCRLIYDENKGVLTFHGKELPTEPVSALNLPYSSGFGNSMLWASDQMSQDVEFVLKGLQAFDFAIRNEALETAIKMANKDERTLIVLLRKGFDMYATLSSKPWRPETADYLLSGLLTILDQASLKLPKTYDAWKGLLGENTLDLVTEAAGRKDPKASTPAQLFLLKLGAPAFQSMIAKTDLPEYQNNDDYIRGTIAVLSLDSEQEAVLKNFQEKAWVKQDTNLLGLIESSLQTQKYQIPADISGQLRQAVTAALELKKQNIPYRWGGKIPKEGLDSVGFIVCVLQTAGLIDKPENWGLERILKEIGQPSPYRLPLKTGDLAFYKGGIIMLCLDSTTVIGMTENGIFLGDSGYFAEALFQVNEVQWR